MKSNSLLIIIPALNESGNIQKIINEIRNCGHPADIVVVNDGSTDTTEEVAIAAGVPVITLPFNLGIGGAVQTGFQYAALKDYDLAVQVDGDGQHDVRFLDVLIQPVLEGRADISIGSRFINDSDGYRSSFVRRIGINFFARLISFLTGCVVTDPTSGFRAMGRQAIEVFSEDYPTDFPEPESIVVAKREGLRVLEVPVEMRKRQAGESSIRYLWTLYYMIKVTFAIMLNVIKSRKRGRAS